MVTEKTVKVELCDLTLVLFEAETALAENLVWLTDKLDLEVRQKDPDTLRRLAQLNAAWISCAKALKV
jgi:hypothetical protein